MLTAFKTREENMVPIFLDIKAADLTMAKLKSVLLFLDFLHLLTYKNFIIIVT